MNFRIALISALLLSSALSFAQNSVKVKSPDGNLELTFSAERKGVTYSIDYKKSTLVDKSLVGIIFDNGNFGNIARFGKAVTESGKEDYDLPVGKTSHVSSNWNGVIIPVTDKNTSGINLSIQIRVFNDAAAFRYIFSSTGDNNEIRIRNERMDINTGSNGKITTLFVPGFINTHEGLYTTKTLDELDEEKLIDMPVLIEYDNGTYMSVTEANLVDYAGMYLIKKDGVLSSRLSPRLDNPEYSVLLEKEGKTPWRVFLASDKIGDLIESTALTSLCDPCKIEDTSWLKPGKTTFSWWNNTQVPDTTFQPGNNFLTNKYYIDFAADNNLEYHSVYGYADMPWYYDDGPGFGHAGPNADLTRPSSVLDFEAVCKYAQSRGVDIHVWLNWAALYKDIDNVFTKFNEWGVKGMMVDFMDRDDQEMIKIQETILQKAAEHKLFIQFHGASKPSGLSRTWPNEFTREGTLNYEVYKWDGNGDMGADHDINMPFTRLLAGPADYHLGGFRSVTKKDFKVHHSSPNVTSTRCHMLAMYVVLESYLNMVCDYPEAYKGEPGFKFLQDVPTSWDETKVLDAQARKYIITARRKGDEWYIGGITNSESRELELAFDFLKDGRYKAELYMDSEDSEEYPNHLTTGTRIFDSQSKFKVRMSASGGFTMKLSPVGNDFKEQRLADPDTTAGLWLRPSDVANARPKWGFVNGIQVGIAPTGGPRGLLRIYTPYLGQPADYVMNFIAIEPIPHKGRDIRGLSELEQSQIDERAGKIFWSSDDNILDESDKESQAKGVIRTVNGEQELTVYIFTEKFLNGTQPYVRLRFKESKPYEFELATFTQQDGTPEPDYCIVTATMGNKARIRNLYLKDGITHSKTLWPDYTGDGFVDHHHVPANKMYSSETGAVYFIAAPDEPDPESVPLAEGTSPGWKYDGRKATQYWIKPVPDLRTEGLVNGRFAYWASRSPIPGGIAYENFEMKSPFKQGDTFIFGISPMTPEDFINTIR